MEESLIWRRDEELDRRADERIQEILSRPLDPDTSVQLGLLGNPALQVKYEQLGIAQADLVQAGLLPNPAFDAEIHFEGSGIGRATNVNIVEDFLQLVTRPMRLRFAQAERMAAEADLRRSVVEFAGEVRGAFYQAQAAEQLHELRQTILQGLEASYLVMSRLHAAGNISDLELASDRAILDRARLDSVSSKLELAESRETLNRLLGLTGNDTEWKSSGRLPDPSLPEVPLEQLEAVAIRHRADLAAARADIIAAGERLGLTRTMRFLPDLALGFDLEGEDNGRVLPGPNIHLTVPLFDRGAAKISRDEALLRQRLQSYRAVALSVRSEVRSARNRMLAAKTRADYAKRALIPTTQRVTRETQKMFNGMLSSVFQLLDAKRAEIEAGVSYVEALRDFWVAQAQLATAVGGTLTPPKEDRDAQP